MRPQAGLNIEAAITELAVGEALVSFLDAKGRPCETERVFVLPPGSQLGPISPEQRQALIQGSLVAGVYEQAQDRESAFERIKGQSSSLNAHGSTRGRLPDQAPTAAPPEQGGLMDGLSDMLFGSTGPRGGQRDGVAQLVVKSAVRTVGSAIGREIVRGVLGGLLGSSRRR
jgi:DNA helicase HerA-like ATPase